MESHNAEEDSALFTVKPTLNHTYTFIFLHGIESNGKKFGQELLEIAKSWDGKKLTDIFSDTKFVFPTAQRHLSRHGERGGALHWFDIASLDNPWHQEYTQIRGLAASYEDIYNVVKKAAEEVPLGNIILGGINQGCAMALSCLMAMDLPLGLRLKHPFTLTPTSCCQLLHLLSATKFNMHHY
ncbi:Phospholipase/carboxylesterase/thioesterase [Biscogniauxia sp. FL1348]|nr:Phospholipase/carboxylesterase/thioesterase [Biscogniauxia sp. FL1348]